MKRYDILNRLDNYQYIYGCPVFITGGNILKDTTTNEIYINLKFRSRSNKNIKAVIISVDCYDIEKEKLSSVNKYIYQDFNICCGEFFGEQERILCPDSNTRSCEIKIKKVIYQSANNEDFWENTDDFQTQSLGLQTRISDWSITNLKKVLYDELEQINYSKNNAIYLPSKFDDGWVCTCGMINFDTPSCSCGMRSVNLFKIFNENYLEEQLSAFEEKNRKKAEEENERRRSMQRRQERELEEKRKIEEMRIKLIMEDEENARRKKTKTIIIYASIIAVILFILLFVSLTNDYGEIQGSGIYGVVTLTNDRINDDVNSISVINDSELLSDYSIGIDDRAGLYTTEQIEELEKKQSETHIATGWNIAVVTTNSGFGTDGTKAVEFAEKYYDNTFGRDSSSVIYLIDVDYRHISMDGDVLNYFNTERLDHMITACEEKYMSHDDVGNLEQFYYYLEYYYNEGTVPYDSNIGS